MGDTPLEAADTLSPADQVEPRIDTHKSRWFYFSSASRPFGMVNLSPDTQTQGSWNSGYLYDETQIRCFSHIHAWQMAGIPVMPAVGPNKGHEGFEGYKSAFSHESEVVKPGYHKVLLDRYGITAELTSTMRVGFHRYAFPAAPEAYVFFDVGAKLAHGPMLDSLVKRVSDRELAGFATMAPTMRRRKPATVYFVAQFDRAIEGFGGWKSGKPLAGEPGEVRGAESGAWVRFSFPEAATVHVKVALSYVSEEQARLNLTAELDHWDFDRVVRESADDWNQALGKIRVEGGTPQQRTKFYTDLWHALLGRRTFSDVNGKYIDNTGDSPAVRQVPLDAAGKPVRHTYNSDSYWGSWWTLNLVWSLGYPQIMNDHVASLVDYYRNGGMIARGPSGGNYTFVMVGDQAIPLIAAAYNKGIRNFNVEDAWAGSVKNAFPGGIRDHAGYEAGANASGGGMKYYVERGYVPLGKFGSGGHREGAAQTMEYAYQDWTLAQFGKALGKADEAAQFEKRAANWRNLFEPSTGYIRPKTMEDKWLEPFTPTCEGFNCRGFVESNAAIYTWFVPHDIGGLVELLGGKEKARAKLEKQFELAAPAKFITPHGKHGENWVDYENQPATQMAHLFSHLGAPWRTQYWVRRIKDEVFGDTSPYGGYNGDEDQGQMGALGVLMAIGLFDLQGGAALEPRYEITTPVFDKVTIALDPRYYPGGTFTIVAKNQQPANVYIQSATLNGKPLNDRFWITHKELAAGGTLELVLGPKPNERWGVER